MDNKPLIFRPDDKKALSESKMIQPPFRGSEDNGGFSGGVSNVKNSVIYDGFQGNSVIRSSHSPTKRMKASKSLKKTKTLKNLKGNRIRRQLKFVKENYQNLIYKPYHNIDLETLECFELFCLALKENKSLEELNISGMSIHPFMIIRLVQAIENHASLKVIDLCNTDISSLGLKYFCRMLKFNEHLERINLFNNKIWQENMFDFEELLRCNKNIKEINLNFCNMESIAVRTFAEIIRQKSPLKRIKLAKENFDMQSIRALSDYLGSHPRLEELDLSYNQLDEEKLKELSKGLPSRSFYPDFLFPKIQKLKLSASKINSESAMRILSNLLVRIRELKSLDLTKNFLSDNLIQILNEKSEEMVWLEELFLSRNKLKMKNIQNSFFPKVKYISLTHNDLEEYSVEGIIKGLKSSQWVSLDLSFNLINEKFLMELLSALDGNKFLKCLNFSSNKIKNKGLDNILKYIGNSSLEEINLSENPLNEKFVEEIFKPETFKGKLKKVYLDKIHINTMASSSKDENASLLGEEVKIDLENLTVLSLKENQLFAEFVIRNLKTAVKLEELYLTAALSTSFDYDLLSFFKEFLGNAIYLRVLHLEKNHLGSLKEPEYLSLFNAISSLPRLQRLNLSHNKLSKILDKLLAPLEKLDSLEYLDLSVNGLENDMSEAIGNYLARSKLKDIDLSSNLIGYTTFDVIADKLNSDSKLEALRVSNTMISSDDCMNLGKLLKNVRLKLLDMSNNKITEINAITLSNSHRLIREIKLRNTKFDSFQYTTLVKIMAQSSTSIEKIDLRGSIFLHQDMTRILRRIADTENLMHLDISYISLYDKEIGQLLRRLHKHKTLQTLKLNYLDCKDETYKGLELLLESNSSLKWLDISDTTVKQSYLDLIYRSFVNNKYLEKLILQGTNLNDELIVHIGNMVGENNFLQHLDISNNPKITKNNIILFFEATKKNKRLTKINLSNAYLVDGFPIRENILSELILSKCFKNDEDIILLCQCLANDRQLKVLDLSYNNLTANACSSISKLILNNSILEKVLLGNNEFGASGISTILRAVEKSTSLRYLDISSNILDKSQTSDASMGKVLRENLINSPELEILDISCNYIGFHSYNDLTELLKLKPKLYIINKSWDLIKNPLAMQLLISLVSQYDKYSTESLVNTKITDEDETSKNIPEYLKKLNFSMGKLDDDFCIFFASQIPKLKFLESIDISDNKKITIIGLKYIYVRLNECQNMKTVYFKSYDRNNFLNTGISESLKEWGRYGNYSNAFQHFLHQLVYFIFSKMTIVPNRFQYGSQFEKYSTNFPKKKVFVYYLIAFLSTMFFSIFLPINFITNQCGLGHKWVSHIIYGVFLLITFIIETIYWIHYKYNLEDAIQEKDIKRDIFINDVLNLAGGAALRLDTYLDVCFITIASVCKYPRFTIVAAIVVFFKFAIKIYMNCSSLYKLWEAIKKNDKTVINNSIAKLAFIQDFVLMGDILDRYIPGNAKRIKKILFFKLQRSIYLGMSILMAFLKLLFEDIPQIIIQITYIIYHNKTVEENNKKSGVEKSTTDGNWIIMVMIVKNLISLFASFYGAVSIRPSFLEQSDFEEKLHVNGLFRKTNRKSSYLMPIGNSKDNSNRPTLKRKSTFLKSQKLEFKGALQDKLDQVKYNKEITTNQEKFAFVIETIPSEDNIQEKNYHIRALDSSRSRDKKKYFLEEDSLPINKFKR